MSFLISYVNLSITFFLSLPYFFKRFRCNEDDELRSLSALLCRIRPYGHLLMNTANLCLFLIIGIEYPLIAWLFWLSLQLILTWDIDTHPRLHLSALLLYISMLLTFWVNVSLRYNWTLILLPIWILTASFSLVWFYNWWNGKSVYRSSTESFEWKFASLQSFVELLWILSISLSFFFYEKMIKEDLHLKSSYYSI